MIGKHVKSLSPEELRQRAMRFYSRYGSEIDQIAELLQIKLQQLALAYTLNNKLPAEAVKIATRVKKLNSFLKKLENDGWPQFYYPTDVIKDLIGARVVCWFVDDCYGMLDFIKASQHFKAPSENAYPLKDFIKSPQSTGYRALHVFAYVPYDGVRKVGENLTVISQEILCEIQIRSKLQDAWGDITHEFFYKAKAHGIRNQALETFLADVCERLSIEDRTLMKFRDTYQKLADDKTKEGKRVGFQENVKAMIGKKKRR